MLEQELDLEIAEVLPTRETLALLNFNIVVPTQVNVAVQLNVLSPGGTNAALQGNAAGFSFSG